MASNDRYLYYFNARIRVRPYKIASLIRTCISLLPHHEYARINHWLNYENKFLRYNGHYGAGFNHNQSYLERYISQALVWNRIPVIFPMLFLLEHNFNQPASPEWENYYDLRNSVIRYDNGKVIPVPYIHSKEFWQLVKPDKQSMLIIYDDQTVSQQDNDKYRFILNWQNSRSLPLYPFPPEAKFRVLLKEAAEVREIGNETAKQLGEKFYVLRYRYPDSIQGRDKVTQEYKQFLSVDFLAKKLPEIIPSGSSLYVMSNIWKQPNYFAQLRKSYRLFTYHDFPVLTRLIETKYPNSFLLIAIENYLVNRLSAGWFRIDYSLSSPGSVKKQESIARS